MKDLLGHMAFWCDESARVLAEIGRGTWDGDDPEREPGRIDRMNRDAVERMRRAEIDAVRRALRDGRAAMLTAFGALGEIPPEADEWFDESGPTHYAEHLPDLERWASRLRSGA